MEIGVADGENARSMVNAATENFPSGNVEYYGFDLFESEPRMRQVERKLKGTGCVFRLFRGDSVRILPKAVKDLPKMDLIFIDGGHAYATAKSDWENSKFLIHNETAVFFHNYDFSGPKEVVDGISLGEYDVRILHPHADCDTALVKKKT